MAVIAPDPVLPFGSAIMPAVPPGPVPFGRKGWDNPIKYKLNRAYGDEFEERSFAELKRKWQTNLISASDLSFPGGSAIEWLPSAQYARMVRAAPAGDFEIVWELQAPYSGGGMVSPIIVNAVGTGVGASIGYTVAGNASFMWNVTTWGYVSTGPNVAATGAADYGQHFWLALRKTGTSYTARVSKTGLSGSWINWATGITSAIVPAYIGIARLFSGATGVFTMHRFNVYPGPTFFPG